MGLIAIANRVFYRTFIERWQRSVLHRIAKELGLTGAIRNHGATQSIRVQIMGRTTDIGIYPSGHWIRMDLAWPGFPESASISHHPEGSYARDSVKSEGASLVATGDMNFDETFMVLCESLHAPNLVSDLSQDIRNAFLQFKDLNPEIATVEFFAIEGPMVPRMHLHASPRSGGASTTAILESVRQCLSLVEKLETNLR